jgi:hypothetical protein
LQPQNAKLVATTLLRHNVVLFSILGMQMLIQQQLVSLSIFDLREVIYFLLSI